MLVQEKKEILRQCPLISGKERRFNALEERSVLAKSDSLFIHSDKRTDKAYGHTVEGGCANLKKYLFSCDIDRRVISQK